MQFIAIAEVSLYSVDGSPVRGREERWGRVKRLPGTRKPPLHPVCLSVLCLSPEDSQCKDIADIEACLGQRKGVAYQCWAPFPPAIPILAWHLQKYSQQTMPPIGGPRVYFMGS